MPEEQIDTQQVQQVEQPANMGANASGHTCGAVASQVLKKYMGVKLIDAMPQDKDGQEGYAVMYPDGYVSWSPKDAFEAAYIPIGENNTITEDVVEDFIAQVTVSKPDNKTTLVKSEQVTGFVQYATASCVCPENYDEATGTAIAMKEIKSRLWFALGFVLQWAKCGVKHTPIVRNGA